MGQQHSTGPGVPWHWGTPGVLKAIRQQQQEGCSGVPRGHRAGPQRSEGARGGRAGLGRAAAPPPLCQPSPCTSLPSLSILVSGAGQKNSDLSNAIEEPQLKGKELLLLALLSGGGEIVGTSTGGRCRGCAPLTCLFLQISHHQAHGWWVPWCCPAGLCMTERLSPGFAGEAAPMQGPTAGAGLGSTPGIQTPCLEKALWPLGPPP